MFEKGHYHNPVSLLYARLYLPHRPGRQKNEQLHERSQKDADYGGL